VASLTSFSVHRASVHRVDVEWLGGFVAVEQPDRVLAPVASEVMAGLGEIHVGRGIWQRVAA
jgi:hypothetical protein